MVRLRVSGLPGERNLTRYRLWKRPGMRYDSYNKMIKNKTHSIRYDIIDSLMRIPHCRLEDLSEMPPAPVAGCIRCTGGYGLPAEKNLHRTGPRPDAISQTAVMSIPGKQTGPAGFWLQTSRSQ